jgi:hypothetical protein
MAFVTYTRNLKPGVSHAMTGEKRLVFFVERERNKKASQKTLKVSSGVF